MATGRNLIVYPKDLEDNRNFPHINFRSIDKDNNKVLNISLYAPQSINFSDGMNYGNFDMGIIGSSFAGALSDDGIDSKIVKDRLRQNSQAAAGEGGAVQAIMLKAMANAGVGGGGIGEKVADIAMRESRIAVNPNTVLQFNGPTVRSFSFEFRLVATSSDEGDVINQIVSSFRERMYPSVPEGSTAILQYPDVFRITFNTGGKFIPNYADSYLTGMSATYNASGNMYHANGSPTDISVSLNFTENKALNRSEITKLQTGGIVEVSGPASDLNTPLPEPGAG